MQKLDRSGSGTRYKLFMVFLLFIFLEFDVLLVDSVFIVYDWPQGG